ncbi:MAG: ATP-binding protein [Alphaproteobacteria bacterium]|jgi:predicted AAA+ superfamily ATPase|nr:ATP-binding protein [Alphaproteobacteria bacterium]MBP9877439.1 ATP-binding protein [Alphaproteobacteria bacterium]
MNIIGRQKEISLFQKILSSKQAEFIAVYGRRRVGKTFLIHEFFSSHDIYLECTGLKDGALKDQLSNFINAFTQTFYPELPKGTSFTPPKSWQEAFNHLTFEFKKISPQKRIIIFFDELPWLASPKSELLQNLDYFWNTQWSQMPNVKLIVCGSAASWMINNLINAKGGLHNRTTRTMLLEPFNLSETKTYLLAKKIKAKNQDILNLYMAIGGIPYYLNHLDPAKSFSQNINELCFKQDGLLYNEFSRLFHSLFTNPEFSIKLVKEVGSKLYGVSMADLLKKLEKKAGGRFQDRLNELEAAGFIKKFTPYGKKTRDHHYRLTDPYCLFYLTWIEEFVQRNDIPLGADYWSRLSKSSKWNSWTGYAFENICHLHADKIIDALNLSNIGCIVSRWRFTPPSKSAENGAEIDMIIDRDDGAITLCEIKYTSDPYVIEKSYARILANKMISFESHFKPNKQVFFTFITTNGLKKNIWSEDLVTHSIDLSAFF